MYVYTEHVNKYKTKRITKMRERERSENERDGEDERAKVKATCAIRESTVLGRLTDSNLLTDNKESDHLEKGKIQP